MTIPNESIPQWVRQAREGDPAAFDELVRRYQDYVVGYATSLLNGDRALAEDAAQEAFLLAYRDLRSLTTPAAFGPWLRRIVHKCCDRLTRRGRNAAPLLFLSMEAIREMPDDTIPNPAAVYQEKAMRAEVRAAVGALPEAERTAVTLFYMAGHSTQEIATFVEASEATVRKRLQRARTRIKETLMSEVEKTLRAEAPSRTTRFAEFATLLRRLIDLLEADPMVRAVYRTPTLQDEGYGLSDDGWASLNLHVVLDDTDMDALATGRRAWAARLAPPLLIEEAPQNAPARGYYLMAIYDGAAGPYEVDWYWHTRSRAAIPSDAAVLFDRVGLPRSGGPVKWGYLEEMDYPEALRKLLAERTSEEAQAEEVRNLVSLFWAMWMIAGKYIARVPGEPWLRHEEFLRAMLAKVQGHLGLPVTEKRGSFSYSSAAAKLAALRAVGREMEPLMPLAAALHPETPTAVVPRAYAYLDLIEQTLRTEGQI